MKRITGGIAAALAAIALAGAGLVAAAPDAAAQEARKHAVAETATVAEIQADRKAFTTRDGEGKMSVFLVDDATVIRLGDDPMPISELEVGDRVAVSARRGGPEPSAHPIADIVQVVREDPAAGGS